MRQVTDFNGAPGEIRTPDLMLRRHQENFTGPVVRYRKSLNRLGWYPSYILLTEPVTDNSVPVHISTITAPVPKKSHRETSVFLPVFERNTMLDGQLVEGQLYGRSLIKSDLFHKLFQQTSMGRRKSYVQVLRAHFLMVMRYLWTRRIHGTSTACTKSAIACPRHVPTESIVVPKVMHVFAHTHLEPTGSGEFPYAQDRCIPSGPRTCCCRRASGTESEGGCRRSASLFPNQGLPVALPAGGPCHS